MSKIGNLLKVQQKLEQLQAEMANRTVEASSGGGAVKVTAKCNGTIASIKIDPAAINPADAQMLEDMVLSAVNQGLESAQKLQASEMGKITQGLGLPGF